MLFDSNVLCSLVLIRILVHRRWNWFVVTHSVFLFPSVLKARFSVVQRLLDVSNVHFSGLVVIQLEQDALFDIGSAPVTEASMCVKEAVSVPVVDHLFWNGEVRL